MRPEDGEGLTVGGLLDLVTERRPQDDALVYVDRGLRYSYAEFNEKARVSPAGRCWRRWKLPATSNRLPA